MNKPGDSIDPNQPREKTREESHTEARVKQTPATDMQAEDAGSADSGAGSGAKANDAGGGVRSGSGASGASGANNASNARPADGGSGASSTGTSSEGAMKQTSKTAAERGSR